MVDKFKKSCPVCGREYECPIGEYRPKTCQRFECAWEYIHNPEKYKTFQEHLDECRMRAKI